MYDDITTLKDMLDNYETIDKIDELETMTCADMLLADDSMIDFLNGSAW